MSLDYGLKGTGFGLVNVIGNTCWLNAFTQLLIHSPRQLTQFIECGEQLRIKAGNEIILALAIIDNLVELKDLVNVNSVIDK